MHYLFWQDRNLTQQTNVVLMFQTCIMEEPDSNLSKDEVLRWVFSLAGKFRFVPHLEHDSCLQTLSNLTLINHPNIRRYIPPETDIDDNHLLSPTERRHCTLIYIRSMVIVSRFYCSQHDMLSVKFSKPLYQLSSCSLLKRDAVLTQFVTKLCSIR